MLSLEDTFVLQGYSGISFNFHKLKYFEMGEFTSYTEFQVLSECKM